MDVDVCVWWGGVVDLKVQFIGESKPSFSSIYADLQSLKECCRHGCTERMAYESSEWWWWFSRSVVSSSL